MLICYGLVVQKWNIFKEDLKLQININTLFIHVILMYIYISVYNAAYSSILKVRAVLQLMLFVYSKQPYPLSI